MSLGDLLILYFIAGGACAVAIYRRAPAGRGAVASAVLAVPLWPLWAPVALTARRDRVRVHRRPSTASARRIEAALREGVEACQGSPFATLLSDEAAERIVAEVARTEMRRAELDALLARDGFELEAAQKRVEALERSDAVGRALATARLHLENLRRLHALRERDERALEELAGLVEALRTQLVLARWAGSSVEGVGGIVSEVWERVESLGEAMEAEAP